MPTRRLPAQRRCHHARLRCSRPSRFGAASLETARSTRGQERARRDARRRPNAIFGDVQPPRPSRGAHVAGDPAASIRDRSALLTSPVTRTSTLMNASAHGANLANRTCSGALRSRSSSLKGTPCMCCRTRSHGCQLARPWEHGI